MSRKALRQEIDRLTRDVETLRNEKKVLEIQVRAERGAARLTRELRERPKPDPVLKDQNINLQRLLRESQEEVFDLEQMLHSGAKEREAQSRLIDELSAGLLAVRRKSKKKGKKK